MNYKFCPNCGKELQPNSNACTECGTILNEQISSSESPQNTVQPVLNKSDKKNIPLPLLIGIIVVIVIAVVAVIIAGHKKPSVSAVKPQTSISTTANTTAQSTTKESTTESTTQTTTITENLTVGNISNVQTNYYNIEDDFGGYAGVMISFEPAKNADGYRLEYVFDDGYGNVKSGFQDIDQNQVKVYFAGQDSPAMVKATPFNSQQGMLFGETKILYDGYHAHFDTILEESEWQSLTSGYSELKPFDYYEY